MKQRSRNVLFLARFLAGFYSFGLALAVFLGQVQEIDTSGKKAAVLGLCAATLFLLEIIPGEKKFGYILKGIGGIIAFIAAYYWILSETNDSGLALAIVSSIGVFTATTLGMSLLFGGIDE